MAGLRFILLGLALFFQSALANAAITLPRLVSDGMVLQQKAPVRIWGWAADGEEVTVALRGQSVKVQARGGLWVVTLKPLEAGGPFEMTIAGEDRIVIKDVFVGEVWVCSGQSNMEFQLSSAFEAQSDIRAAPDPALRMFTVGKQLAEVPKVDVAGKWEGAAPETRGHFSAVGYYFGRALRAARQVPIGLIHTSWGGTPAEAWTSRSALQAWGMPATDFDALAPPNAASNEVYERSVAAWQAAGRPQGTFDDPGLLSAARVWASPQSEVRDWRSQSLPRAWEHMGPDMQVDGGIWFRREVNLPVQWAGHELDLYLGAIDDVDTTYFNGAQIGATGTDVPNHWQVPRRYKVPASAVRAGRAVLAVRVWDHGGEGGFTGPASEMWLGPAGNAAGSGATERLSLAGEWRFKPERTRPSVPVPPGLNQNLPSVLFNGMLAPLLPYTIQGATWYQGESNTGRPAQYRSLLTALIQGWRSDFQRKDFPFLIVQLAPYMAIQPEPGESGWAALREAQVQVARDLRNVGVAVITDVGDEKDVHPTRKRPVGERLALAARKIAYDERIVASGPSFRSAKADKGKLVVRFDNVGQGLEARGGPLTGFALAGADKKFVNAAASIVGQTVVVSSPQVATPAYIRFGWADYPVVNLWNEDGLPATPFRTDPE